MATQATVIDATNTPPQPEWQNATLINERAQLLVDNWNSACHKLADLYDEVEAIQKAFDGLKDGQEILGCTGFKVFCVRHLKRDPSTVYRMLKKARLELEPAVEEENIFSRIEGGEEEGTEEGEDEETEEGEEEASAKKKKEKGGRTRLEMTKLRNAFFADRYLNLIGLLVNAPKDASPDLIVATMKQEAEASYEDLDPELAEQIQIPILASVEESRIAGLQTELNLSKKENATLSERLQANTREIPEHLKDENITASLSAEPDRNQSSSMLTQYLQTIAERVLPPEMASSVKASVTRVGRDKRIMPGDWLKKEATLAKCTGVREFMDRRVVSEWNNTKWDKEHVVFNEQDSDYRVITEPQARELAPGAFAD